MIFGDLGKSSGKNSINHILLSCEVKLVEAILSKGHEWLTGGPLSADLNHKELNVPP